MRRWEGASAPEVGSSPIRNEPTDNRALPGIVNGVRVMTYLCGDDWSSARTLVSPTAHSSGNVRAGQVEAVVPDSPAAIVADPSIGMTAVVSLAESLTSTSAMLILVGHANVGSIEACLHVQGVRPTPCFLGDSGGTRWLSAALRYGATIDPESSLLHAWHREIVSLPPAPRMVLCSVLAGNAVPADAAAFIDRCGSTRRTVERSFDRASLPGLARTLIAIRLARSWTLMQDNRLSIARAAREVGFGSVRTFSRTCAQWTGVPPSEVRNWSSQLWVGRILDYLAHR